MAQQLALPVRTSEWWKMVMHQRDIGFRRSVTVVPEKTFTELVIHTVQHLVLSMVDIYITIIGTTDKIFIVRAWSRHLRKYLNRYGRPETALLQ